MIIFITFQLFELSLQYLSLLAVYIHKQCQVAVKLRDLSNNVLLKIAGAGFSFHATMQRSFAL